MSKPKVATCSLAGCFGCHMSFLDIDERILELVELVDFGPSPFNDLKQFTALSRVAAPTQRMSASSASSAPTATSS